MAGGDSNPISRKLYARVKEMLVEQQRSPTAPLPHIDNMVDHLMQRSCSLQQYPDCKRMPRNSLRKALVDSVIPRFAAEAEVDGKKRRREGEGEEGGDAEAGAPAQDGGAAGEGESNRANSGMQRLYKMHSTASSAGEGEGGGASQGDSSAKGTPRPGGFECEEHAAPRYTAL
ncbi:hypothetical protein T484DRAFT_1913344 [Baffinella frigidus]|nr:hypothetical protein T484DRAFT_1913344 [Cryptophyta sp. CCMP2293]